MKKFKYLFQLVLLSLVVVSAASCARDYEEPPLVAPQYTPSGLRLSIEDLKAKYKDVADQPVLIDVDYHLKVNVVANDISGNIFKQIYFQDATGGINFGVDQNNVATEYGAGQEVFIQLHGLYILKYGGEFQIGYASTQANRIPWEYFKEHVHKNDFAKPSNAVPTQLDLALLYSPSTSADVLNSLVNTLVVMDNVHFINGGKNFFVNPDLATTEEVIKDSKGNSVTLRTSKYASPFVGRLLPKGNGKVTGILGRHNGNWQFIVRDINDANPNNFDGKEPNVDPGDKDAAYSENFGDPKKVDNKWPLVGTYTGWSAVAPITYADRSGKADIRALGGRAHVWMAKGSDVYFTVSNISTTGMTDLVLTYEIAAGVYALGEKTDLALVQVTANGTRLNVPSTISEVKEVPGDQNKFYTITVDNFPIGDNITLEFLSPNADNLFGFRVANIKIGKKGDTTITPSPAP